MNAVEQSLTKGPERPPESAVATSAPPLPQLPARAFGEGRRADRWLLSRLLASLGSPPLELAIRGGARVAVGTPAARVTFDSRATMLWVLADVPLRFGDASFDAVFSNDVLCHIPGRDKLLRELHRVLKPGGRLLFSDALVIGGVISHQEIAARSSIGYFLFSPPGENERMLREVGFVVLEATDTTANARKISKRWHEARAKRAEALTRLEGQENFEGLQRFLSTVYRLTSERRLCRLLYCAEQPR